MNIPIAPTMPARAHVTKSSTPAHEFRAKGVGSASDACERPELRRLGNRWSEKPPTKGRAIEATRRRRNVVVFMMPNVGAT
jgi:hypothetical protein